MRRELLVIAVAAATPCWGQDAERGAAGGEKPTAASTQSGAAIPDFSGIWAHPSFPGFEPPVSGPGPVVNTSRRPQVTDADGRILPPGNKILVSNPALLVGDITNPILKPHAAEIVKKHGELELSGAGSPSPTIQCWPEPVPYIFNGVAMLMLQQPDRITFLYPNDHQVRHVRMNVPHPAQVTPSWYGDSVGHYEGDTLVIDTVGVKVGPFAMVERDAHENLRPARGADAGSAPQADYRGKHLQLEFRVEDDGVFTMPWTATITYRRGFEAWREIVCAENTRELAIAGRGNAVPTADKPDF
jgi:hypothetical protein